MYRIFLASVLTIYHVWAAQNNALLTIEHADLERAIRTAEFYSIVDDDQMHDYQNNKPRSPVNPYMERIDSERLIPLTNHVVNHQYASRHQHLPYYVPDIEKLELNKKIKCGQNKKFTMVSTGLPTTKPRIVAIQPPQIGTSHNTSFSKVHPLPQTFCNLRIKRTFTYTDLSDMEE